VYRSSADTPEVEAHRVRIELELAAVSKVKTPVVVGYEGVILSGDALNLIRAVGGVASVDLSVPKVRVDVVMPVPQAITPAKDAERVTDPGGVNLKKSEQWFTEVPVIEAWAFRVNE
jgi:hypothetical protein